MGLIRFFKLMLIEYPALKRDFDNSIHLDKQYFHFSLNLILFKKNLNYMKLIINFSFCSMELKIP